MKKFWKAVSLTAVVGLIAASLAGCGNADQGKTTDDKATGGVDRASKLVMATNASFPPFEYVVANKGLVGQFDGIDVAIAMEIAADANKTLEVSDMDFNSIVSAVSAGKADMGIAGMTVKPDRLENVDFSDTYWIAMQTIMVQGDNTDITDVQSLAGKSVGVITGYTGDSAISEANIAGVDIRRYNKGVDAVADLKNKKLDAVVIDSPTAASFIQKNPELKGIEDGEFFEKEEYAICVKKGNTELLEQINKTIARLKESGRIEAIAAEVDARVE